MEIRMNCGNCVGSANCNKYCDIQIGINLVNFISGVDTCETKIGEFNKDSRTGKITYICSGHILENSSNPAYILSDLQTNIDASGKFITCGGLQPQQIMQNYLNTISAPQEAKDAALMQFNKFNTLKVLLVPFKPGIECEVTIDSNGQAKNSPAKVHSLKWQADKQSGKISCIVICSVDKSTLFDNAVKLVKIPITEYGTSLRLPHVERTLKSSEIKREVIKVTDLGVIRPILVKDGKTTLAIDGSHLYKIVDTRVFIIGNWQNGKIVDVNAGLQQVKETKAYKYIKSTLGYIEKHKRFIAPYGVFVENIIQI